MEDSQSSAGDLGDSIVGDQEEGDDSRDIAGKDRKVSAATASAHSAPEPPAPTRLQQQQQQQQQPSKSKSKSTTSASGASGAKYSAQNSDAGDDYRQANLYYTASHCSRQAGRQASSIPTLSWQAWDIRQANMIYISTNSQTGMYLSVHDADSCFLNSTRLQRERERVRVESILSGSYSSHIHLL